MVPKANRTIPSAGLGPGNAPFQWVKQVASHLGGTRNPMIVTWPARIKDKGGIRTQFTHLIDVVPTILEAAQLPARRRLWMASSKSRSMASRSSPRSTVPDAKPVRQRQYFEVFSNRAIYDNGWIACAQHTFPWRQDYAPGNWDKDKWELYNLDEDFSEANDLAAKMPEKLAEMKALFDEEAEKNHVYPLDDRGTGRIYEAKPSPGGSDPKRTQFTYYPGAVRLAETAAPNTKNKSHTITADIIMPESGGEGVIVAIGGSSGGYSLFVQDGKLVYHFNWFDEDRYIIKSSEPVPPGKSTVRFEFTLDDGDGSAEAMARFSLTTSKLAAARIEKTVPGRFGIDTFGVGMDTGSPVSNSYKPPFAFSGKIEQVRIELK